VCACVCILQQGSAEMNWNDKFQLLYEMADCPKKWNQLAELARDFVDVAEGLLFLWFWYCRVLWCTVVVISCSV